MKHRLVRICVFLLLGAIVNVAVAMTLWNWGQRPVIGTFDAIDAWGKRPLTSVDLDTWRRLAADDWPQPLGDHCLGQTFFGTRFSWMIAAKNDFDPRELNHDEWVEKAQKRVMYSLEITEVGWPLPIVRVAEARVVGGMPPTIAQWDDAAQLGRHRLPRPHSWSGFAINTVFYAAVLWLLFAAPFAWRRRRRIKRGLCPKCAYDLRGSAANTTACPECGTPR